MFYHVLREAWRSHLPDVSYVVRAAPSCHLLLRCSPESRPWESHKWIFTAECRYRLDIVLAPALCCYFRWLAPQVSAFGFSRHLVATCLIAVERPLPPPFAFWTRNSVLCEVRRVLSADLPLAWGPQNSWRVAQTNKAKETENSHRVHQYCAKNRKGW